MNEIKKLRLFQFLSSIGLILFPQVVTKDIFISLPGKMRTYKWKDSFWFVKYTTMK